MGRIRGRITLEEYCKKNNMNYLLDEWDYEKIKFYHQKYHTVVIRLFLGNVLKDIDMKKMFIRGVKALVVLNVLELYLPDKKRYLMHIPNI